MTDIHLYTEENIDDFVWPENCKYEKNYILPFIKEGAKKYIANVETQMAILQVNDALFPVTINNEEYESSYVCSPYNACVSYPKVEMSKIENKFLEFILRNLVNLFGAILKSANVNKVVSINNWLLSTNLYRDWDGKDIDSITDFFIKRYPDHAIMSRSLNYRANSKLLEEYKKSGYYLLPSRQVYLFDRKKKDYCNKNNTKWDLKRLKTTEYRIVEHHEISAEDYPRIADLYNKLYLEKYSYHNPQFTIEIISLWHKQQLIIMQGLRNDKGVLDGVVGYFELNGITTAPLVGYDTCLVQSLGLYRMLIALVMKRAYTHDIFLNLSSGASKFKRLRGGLPEIEYSVLCTKHLSLYRRGVWRAFTWILVSVAVPLMRKYQL